MFCAMCGFKLADNARFCSGCGAPVTVSKPAEDKLVEQPVFTEMKPAVEPIPATDIPSELPRVEFDILDHSISFDQNMVVYNELRKQFSINASKHKAEYIEFYNNKVKSFDDLLGIAYPELGNHIVSSVNFGVSVLMSYGIDHIDADTLEGLAIGRINPEPVMAPIIEAANKIQNRVDQISRSRGIERASRSQWYGGGFGLKGAIKGALTAGALNTATNAFRGIGDSLTDSGDRSTIEAMKRNVYADPATRNRLLNGVYECCFAVFFSVCTVLEDENMMPPLRFDTKRQDARLKNYAAMFDSDPSLRPKLIDILCDCIQYCPYRADYYVMAYGVALCKKETILPVAQYFGLENNYLERIAPMDKARLKTIKAMPEKTAADIEKKIAALAILNSGNPNSGASEILSQLQRKAAELQREESLDDVMTKVAKVRKHIDDATTKGDIHFIWTEMDKGNVYAEYVLDKYYMNMYSESKKNGNQSAIQYVSEHVRTEAAKHGETSKLFSEYLQACLPLYSYKINEMQECHIKELIKIASQGSVPAMAWLGNYGRRSGSPGVTMEESITYLQKAADAQHPEALECLGRLYMKGECGLVNDNEKAGFLLAAATAYGMSGAKAYLAFLKSTASAASPSISNSPASSNPRFITTADKAEIERFVQTCFSKVSRLLSKKRVFVTKDIPANKLAIARAKYATGMSSDEFVLLLSDSTIWGSSKAGCLLTNKALYFSRALDQPIRVPIEDIIGFRYLEAQDLEIQTKQMKYTDISTIYAVHDDADKHTAGKAFAQLFNDILQF